ncbi:MAG: hypothetical protein ACLFN5_02355 [bacterium]
MIGWWLLYAVFVLLAIIIFVKMGSKGSEFIARKRTCPICGSTLKQDERLFADEITRGSGPSELKIKGCTHCYKKE